jgi:hypothetical protein
LRERLDKVDIVLLPYSRISIAAVAAVCRVALAGNGLNFVPELTRGSGQVQPIEEPKGDLWLVNHGQGNGRNEDEEYEEGGDNKGQSGIGSHGQVLLEVGEPK